MFSAQEAIDSINELGCAPYQLDDDYDGTTNDLDQCPNTPSGQPVDQQGCALDDPTTTPDDPTTTPDDPEEDPDVGQPVDSSDGAGDSDVGTTSSGGGGLCGIFGMLNLAGIFAGLSMLRLSHRCRRSAA